MAKVETLERSEEGRVDGTGNIEIRSDEDGGGKSMQMHDQRRSWQAIKDYSMLTCQTSLHK